MAWGETERAIVERHVAEGSARLVRQRALVARLAPDHRLLSLAEMLLATMEATQRLHEAHLASLNRAARL